MKIGKENLYVDIRPKDSVHYQILSQYYYKKCMETSKENSYVDIRASKVNTSRNSPNWYDKELCMDTNKEDLYVDIRASRVNPFPRSKANSPN